MWLARLLVIYISLVAKLCIGGVEKLVNNIHLKKVRQLLN